MPRSLTIGGVVIDDSSPAFTIAELGSSAEANTELTKRFIDAAAGAGASSVKLQKRGAGLFTKAALDAEYSGVNSFGKTYGEHRHNLEYTGEQMLELCQYAHEKGLLFGVTPFDCSSAEMLWEVGVDFIKIASACVTDTVLLEFCASQGPKTPIVLSTGTGTQHDVDLAVQTITQYGCPLALLQCSAIYPLQDLSLLHLRVIETYRQRYPFIVTGLSSHESGWQDTAIAYAIGGRIFEKHFTLDRKMRGADHAFSLEPDAFKDMTRFLTWMLPGMLGSPIKQRLPEEQPAIVKMGKVLRAARDLPAGHTLSREDVAIKSPGWPGVPPSRLAEYIGRTLPDAVAEDEPLPELGWSQ